MTSRDRPEPTSLRLRSVNAEIGPLAGAVSYGLGTRCDTVFPFDASIRGRAPRPLGRGRTGRVRCSRAGRA
jgi:hypothetical protein